MNNRRLNPLQFILLLQTKMWYRLFWNLPGSRPSWFVMLDPERWSTRSLSPVKAYSTMLGEIYDITKPFQTRGHTLASCREDINKLVNADAEEKCIPGAPLYKCKLGTSTMMQQWFLTLPLNRVSSRTSRVNMRSSLEMRSVQFDVLWCQLLQMTHTVQTLLHMPAFLWKNGWRRGNLKFLKVSTLILLSF